MKTTTTQMALVQPEEFVTFLELKFPVARKDADGAVWVEAVEAARVLGMEPKDGANAARRVPDGLKGLLSKQTPGGTQDVWMVNAEGLLHMSVNARGKEGAGARKRLMDFSRTGASALSTGRAPASLRSEQERAIRLQTAFLNAEARSLREKRLAAGIAAPRVPPVSRVDNVGEKLLAAIRAKPGMATVELHRALGNNCSGKDLQAALASLLSAGLVRCTAEAPRKGMGRKTHRYFPVEGGAT